ncbi:MAG: putative aldouronate transport system permease protein [Clostridiales bacterium]|jgi:putative aldouronate transport system permease protein|uniref:Carbohydrate ABC transporter membrane protein 2, CUT1 family n=1 Tax=Mahella australiensis (strain DSM 15567 / CIP 107919 / 50-1 BON) TaxID=697281 RepID=F4A1U0_MAHA5|nr:carbohydrate ABC transporter permease [Mahella australiensis]AEE97140.1 carbohydrate ABC transporter membrane protein 2, CUT1 family [Mahella australiensis 50-1 BON]MDI3508084.1 putative aldouronate transport system permease protein [Clostridiales bacterium]MDK2990780.1 putative aldouronate transport system permease protein [Clostridiales bacterium]
MNNRLIESRSDKAFDIVNGFLLVLITVIVLYPLIYVVSASFSDPMKVLNGEIILLPKGINLDAYKKVFADNEIISGYWNTILYTLVGTAVNVILSIITAYPLSRKDLRGGNIFMGLFTFTMFFSGGLVPTYLIIRDLGLIDNFWVMVLPGAISIYNVIIMRTYFQSSIPFELQESAMLDGCSNWRILWSIILPLSMPIIAVMVLFYGVGHWNSYFDALIYLRDQAKYPLQLVLRKILVQNQMQQLMNSASESIAQQQVLAEGIKYATIVVASVPVLIIYPFLQRYFVKGVMIGAIKG